MGFLSAFKQKNQESKLYFFHDRLKFSSDFRDFIFSVNNLYQSDFQKIVSDIRENAKIILNSNGDAFDDSSRKYYELVSKVYKFIDTIFENDNQLIQNFLREAAGKVLYSDGGTSIRYNGATNVRLTQFKMRQGRQNFAKAFVFQVAYEDSIKNKAKDMKEFKLYHVLLNTR